MAVIGDEARGRGTMTPVVRVAADDDADATDQLHHDISKMPSGKLEYALTDDNSGDKWFWDASVDVTTSSADLISGDFTSGGAVDGTGDTMRFLGVRNTGKTDTGAATTAVIYIATDGAAATSSNMFAVGPREYMQMKFAQGPNAEDINVVSSSGTVRCEVVAVINDTA